MGVVVKRHGKGAFQVGVQGGDLRAQPGLGLALGVDARWGYVLGGEVSTSMQFEREEIRPGQKIGWSLDDLYAEAAFNPGEDDSLYDDGKSELNFDWS